MTGIHMFTDTTAPTLDPSTFNRFTGPHGGKVEAYYSPSIRRWSVVAYHNTDDGRYHPSPIMRTYTMRGIEATEWPEVWGDLASGASFRPTTIQEG